MTQQEQDLKEINEDIVTLETIQKLLEGAKQLNKNYPATHGSLCNQCDELMFVLEDDQINLEKRINTKK